MKFLSSDESQLKIRSLSKKTLTGLSNAVANIYVVLFIPLFFIASPKTYINGIILLMPEKGKPTTKQFLGMPMVLALALIAGVLNFIPNFGPWIAMVPAVLIALTIGNSSAWIVAVLYSFIQIMV